MHVQLYSLANEAIWTRGCSVHPLLSSSEEDRLLWALVLAAVVKPQEGGAGETCGKFCGQQGSKGLLKTFQSRAITW